MKSLYISLNIASSIFRLQNQAMSCHHSHILSKSSCPYSYISPPPPPHFYRPTSNHLLCRCSNLLNLPCLTTSAILWTPKTVQILTSLSILQWHSAPSHHRTLNSPLYIIFLFSRLGTCIFYIHFIQHFSCFFFINTGVGVHVPQSLLPSLRLLHEAHLGRKIPLTIELHYKVLHGQMLPASSLLFMQVTEFFSRHENEFIHIHFTHSSIQFVQNVFVLTSANRISESLVWSDESMIKETAQFSVSSICGLWIIFRSLETRDD